jgi:carboxylesterase type B
MVWIHGGFLQFGSGHQPGLRPSGKLAKMTDKVYVSLNYRLYAFGFMPLDLLVNDTNNGTDDNPSPNDTNSTNFGLMDVVLALHWIQDNIRSFGGDSRKVTLFGADSGAALILAIISNKNLKHLYSNSWLINPALYLNHTFAEVSTHNKKNFLKHSGCKTLDCLRSLSSTQVVDYFLGKNDPSFRINDQNDLPILGIMSEQLIIIDGNYYGFPFCFSR